MRLSKHCFCSFHVFFSVDLGHGEADESQQILKLEQASLNTTKLVYREVNNTDLIVHVGDLSYAVGFASQVI